MSTTTSSFSAEIATRRAEAAADDLIAQIKTINKEFRGLTLELEGPQFETDYDALRFNLASTFANMLSRKELITP